MKREQSSKQIENVGDRFFEKTEHNNGIKQFLVIAVVLVLMMCSFGVGAVSFAKETIVEVPVDQEAIPIDEIGLTVILPDEWKGKYGVELNEDGTGCAVYVKDIHDGNGEMAGLGYLFWIGQAATDKPMTPEELYAWSPTPCNYLFSTADATYILEKHSDIQYAPSDSAEAELYMYMSNQISELKFQINNPGRVD